MIFCKVSFNWESLCTLMNATANKRDGAWMGMQALGQGTRAAPVRVLADGYLCWWCKATPQVSSFCWATHIGCSLCTTMAFMLIQPQRHLQALSLNILFLLKHLCIISISIVQLLPVFTGSNNYSVIKVIKILQPVIITVLINNQHKLI